MFLPVKNSLNDKSYMIMLYPYLVWTELFPLTKKAFGLHQQFPILEIHNTLSRAGL